MVRLHRIYLTLLLQSHIYQAVPTYVRRKTETKTFHVYSLDSVAFVLGVWTWCLEQSASSTERHRCCLHLQASLKVWTLLSSLRRFDDCFNRCWSLRLFALLIDVFFSLTNDDMCVVFILTLFLVSLGLYEASQCRLESGCGLVKQRSAPTYEKR